MATPLHLPAKFKDWTSFYDYARPLAYDGQTVRIIEWAEYHPLLAQGYSVPPKEIQNSRTEHRYNLIDIAEMAIKELKEKEKDQLTLDELRTTYEILDRAAAFFPFPHLASDLFSKIRKLYKKKDEEDREDYNRRHRYPY